ncbi:hypothetical protein ABZ570_29405 [Micromonospora sp. NPDC007271]|uniref:hypothetical protein n=1 Tax=Micromonospora sp. NPDC007271 TaxID=3154587 RepID=UPI0033C049F5
MRSWAAAYSVQRQGYRDQHVSQASSAGAPTTARRQQVAAAFTELAEAIDRQT